MIQSQRFQNIEKKALEKGIVNTKEMAELLGVTETTIRRDFEELERRGKIIRVHGGAKGIRQKSVITMTDELVIDQRTGHGAEKDAVCRKAASFVQEGSCVFLDGGSSLVPMARYLKNREVRIVTNNLRLVSEMQDARAEVFFIGGTFIPKYSMNAGPMAIEEVARFNFDYSFISCLGLDLDRQLIYTAELETMAVKAAAMRVSSNSVLLLDASKLYVKAFCSLISMNAFDFMICNNDPSLIQENLPANFLLVDVD